MLASCTSEVLSQAFTGEGARLYGGRWNSPGQRVVYTSEELSLAVMEVLVHLDVTMPQQVYLAIPAQVPDDLLEEIALDELPDGWSDYTDPAPTRDIGHRWLTARRSPGLLVPSAVLPLKRNVLLNPEHDSFREISVGQPVEFVFDRRLLFRLR